MSTLYELKSEYEELLYIAADPNTDPDVLKDTMEAIAGEIEDKADGYARVIKELESETAGIRLEIARMAARKQAIEGNVKRMKENLECAMRATGMTKFKTTLFSFGIQKNPAALKIDDPTKIPPEYFIPQDPKVDTAAIKQALKDGVECDWCHLEQSESLRIR